MVLVYNNSVLILFVILARSLVPSTAWNALRMPFYYAID